MLKEFSIEYIISKLKAQKKEFKDEREFQLAMATLIKEIYQNEVTVCIEFCPIFDFSIKIDILVIMNNRWYPIELKYRKKDLIDDKNKGGYTQQRQNIFIDIERIKKIKSFENKYGNNFKFGNGYAIFLTNDGFYLGENTSKGIPSINAIDGNWQEFSNSNDNGKYMYLLNKI